MKTQLVQSVVKEWVSALPFTQQAVLLCALRGPDGLPKFTAAKDICFYLRGAVLHAAMPEYDKDKSYTGSGFMREDYKNFDQRAEVFFCDTDAYPMHFLMHLMHAAQIIGYKHPDEEIRNAWNYFYTYFVHCLHLRLESEGDMDERLKY